MKSLIKFVITIYAAGPAMVILYVGVAGCLGLIAYNLFSPVSVPINIEPIIDIVLIMLLADILYLKLRDNNREKTNTGLKNSGVNDVLPCMEKSDLKELFLLPGKKRILNIFIYNFSEVQPLIIDSITKDNAEVEITILDPESKHVDARGKELGKRNTRGSIEENIDDIVLLYEKLSSHQRRKLRVFFFDGPPKFIFYSSGDSAMVGLFWLREHAVLGPQFLIKGRSGSFSSRIWSHYTNLDKTEKTEELIERIKANKVDQHG